MRRTLTVALLAAFTLLTGCTNQGEVDSLRGQVASLQVQVSTMSAQANGFHRDLVRSRRALWDYRMCLGAFRGVVDSLAGAAKYLDSNSQGLAFVDDFYAPDCKGVLRPGPIRGVRRAVSDVQGLVTN